MATLENLRFARLENQAQSAKLEKASTWAEGRGERDERGGVAGDIYGFVRTYIFHFMDLDKRGALGRQQQASHEEREQHRAKEYHRSHR